MKSGIKFFRHSPGDGLHYINDNMTVTINGLLKIGETSEASILLHTQWICEKYSLPPLWEMWTRVYPESPMTVTDAQLLVNSALLYTDHFDLRSDEQISLVLNDLHCIHRGLLANEIYQRLVARGLKIGTSMTFAKSETAVAAGKTIG
jgi:hypothetical protein